MNPSLVEEATTKLSGPLKFLGALAGGLLGIGAILFYTGFNAQRAQFELAELPVAFVDYWAYAEVGSSALLHTLAIALGNYWLLGILFGLTAALIFLLEIPAFRRFLRQPLYLLLLTSAHLVLVVLVLRQQLAVNSLAKPASEFLPRTATISQELPVRFPFSLLVPRVPAPPSELPSDFGNHDSASLWNSLADYLESSTKDREYLPLRPTPPWHLPSANNHQTSRFAFFPPRPAGPQWASSQEQAYALYRGMIHTIVVLMWSWALLMLWARRIERELLHQRLVASSIIIPGKAASNPSVSRALESVELGTSHAGGELWTWAIATKAFEEECWWVSRHLAITTSAIGIVLIGLILLPDTFGILQMSHIGHERVEIVLRQGAKTNASPNGLNLMEIQPSRTDQNEKVAMSRLLDEYTLAEPDDKEQLAQRWLDAMKRVTSTKSQAAIQFVESMISMAQSQAPELARSSLVYLDELRSHVSGNLQGYILYYPRSQTETHLRLLSPASALSPGPWRIVPVPLADISEIRVSRDIKTPTIVEVLRQLGDRDVSDRQRLFIKLELESPPWMLEIAEAALRDSDPNLASSAPTMIARYAKALDSSSLSQLRRRRALSILLRTFEDKERPIGVRGAAATAIRYVAPLDMRHVAGRPLLEFLQGTDREDQDPYWESGGSIISSLGLLGFKEAAPLLASWLSSPSLPIHVRAVIPTALSNLEESDVGLSALMPVLTNQSYPVELVGPSLTALGKLGSIAGHASRLEVLQALSRFIFECESDPRLNGDQADIVRLRGASIAAVQLMNWKNEGEVALSFLINRGALDSASQDNVVDTVCQMLRKSGLPAAEDPLLDLALDEKASRGLRIEAIQALGTHFKESTLHQVFRHWQSSQAMVPREERNQWNQAIYEFFEERRSRGSSRARRYCFEVERILRGAKSSLQDADSLGGAPDSLNPAAQLEQLLRLLQQSSDKPNEPGDVEAPVSDSAPSQ